MKIRLFFQSAGSYGYEVWCEPGLRHFLDSHIENLANKRKAFWIWDRTVFNLWKEEVVSKGLSISWDGGEHNKNLASVEYLARELVRFGADRSSVLVAVGGGVTGDVVGFLASIYMRGIPVVQVPTTLVAQVDSSIGGKTGVDLPEGKNLIGTFHQPLWVAIDPEFLKTLPEAVFYQGMAEVIKTAWIGDPELIDILEKKAEEIKGRSIEALLEVVGRCVKIKANIVMADEKESGLRKKLNLGHTFGHAIEKASNYTIPHGEAVAIGCLCAIKLGIYLGITSPVMMDKMENLLRLYHLPTRIPETIESRSILEAFYADKKKVGERLTFVVPKKPGEVHFYEAFDLSRIEEVIKECR